jgi:signal peptidase I
LRKWRAEHTFLSLVGEVVFLLVFVILPFRTFIAQPFMVSGESMAPTFSDDDYLIVNQLSKRVSGEFDRFDVVIFRYPKDESKFFIKRIVALPGERVMVSNDQVTIYNENNPEGLTLDNGYTQGITTGSNDITLSQDEYFVLGDNRSNSSDSRFWGPLPLKNIIGTPLIRVYPFNKADLQPGQVLP